MVVVLRLTGGDQVPDMPLVEVVGILKFCPAQNGPSGVKVGFVLGATETLIVVVLAQKVGSGVKV